MDSTKYRFILLYSIFFFLSPFSMGFSATIDSVDTYGAFETAGVTIKLSGNNHDETARILVNGTEAYPFTRYDGNHMSTSLFNLSPGTTYNLTIELTDPDGDDDSATSTVTTKSAYSIPSALRTVAVSSTAELTSAISNAIAGDRIVIASGEYSSTVSISSKNGTESNPIVFTAADTSNRPHFTNGVTVYQSSYLVFDHLEVEVSNASYSGGYGGMDFRGSHHITITNCYIHDCDAFGTYTANIFIEHNDENVGSDKNGYFLIMNNVISDENPPSWPWDDSNSCEETVGHTYVGIKMDFKPGGYNIICRNLIYGVLDGIATGGDEGHDAPGWSDNDVLTNYPNQNVDIYDNIIYHVRDDCIELDGHTMNVRVFRNRLGECQNAISTAPVYPGPIFIYRNYLYGFKEGASKLNTAVDGETRHVYWYHNTIKQHSNGQWCLYRGMPGFTRNIQFKNNIIMATGPVLDCDISGAHLDHVFDYNLMYSSRNGRLWNDIEFYWGDTPGSTVNYATWGDFRSGSGQEANGTYGEASLSTSTVTSMPTLTYIPSMNNVPTIPASQYFILNLGLETNSNGINAGVHIPGINDGYSSSAPDCGALESGVNSDGPFTEWVLIQNPSESTAGITATFMKAEGANETRSITIAPRSRHSIYVDDIVPGSDVSTKIVSNVGVVVERSMYRDVGSQTWGAGHCSIGSKDISTLWYLAEGCVGGAMNFDEWVLIQNPNSTSVDVVVTFMLEDGSTTPLTKTIDANSRYSVHVNDYISEGAVSTRVVSSAGVIAERAMYWDSGGETWVGAHCSLGVTSTSTIWYLAEGSTRTSPWNFQEYVLIQNPNSSSANVTLTFMQPGGVTSTKNIIVGATSRKTIHVNEEEGLSDADVSVKVESTNGIGIIAERAMYWDAGGVHWAGGHCSAGVIDTSNTWYLAEGCTNGFSEWVLLQNPNATPAICNVTFMMPNETTSTTSITVDATSRYTIYVNDYIPSDSVSVKVESTNSVGIIAERAMYWPARQSGGDANGIHWVEGHCSVGSPSTGTTWYLAEGCT